MKTKWLIIAVLGLVSGATLSDAGASWYTWHYWVIVPCMTGAGILIGHRGDY